MRLFLGAAQVCEIRALAVGNHRAVSFISSDVQAMALRAAEWDQAGAKGVYFTPNPLRPDLEGSRASARKADVARRHWLLIDVDPVRPADSSSTEPERHAAWAVLDACRGTLDGAGLRGAVVGDSGNGWHLCYPIELPNDDASQELVKAVLKGLQARCGSEQAQVDTACHDAPRIWKLYGTHARKGTGTADRPHRLTRIVEGSVWEESAAQANTGMLSRLLEMWRYIDDAQKGRPGGDLIARARSYISKAPPAISGQGGHDRTFNVACLLVKDFGLTVDQALEAIQDWNKTCQPPWSEHDLRHKLADAAKKEGPVGRLAGTNGTGTNGASNGHYGEDTEPPKGFPAPIPASKLKAAEKSLWLWKGFINRGGITLLSALWKSGKTTLLASMLKALETGGTFCDHDIEPSKALFVTEESETRWADRRDRLGLKDHIEFLIRPFTGKPRWDDWKAFLDYAVHLTKQGSYDLVVFDPLVNLWPVKDENDASQVTAALMPLHQVADKTSILLVHHTRKGDGQEATASRGSGALTAFVDTIIELRRYAPEDAKDRRRVLTGFGRDDDTLQEIVVELGEEGEYRTQGTRKDSKESQLTDAIDKIMPVGPPGITFNEIKEKIPETMRIRSQKLFDRVSEGVSIGLWKCSGTGVKGDPRRYWKIDVSPNSMPGHEST
jgi:hypothetical protein